MPSANVCQYQVRANSRGTVTFKRSKMSNGMVGREWQLEMHLKSSINWARNLDSLAGMDFEKKS